MVKTLCVCECVFIYIFPVKVNKNLDRRGQILFRLG